MVVGWQQVAVANAEEFAGQREALRQGREFAGSMSMTLWLGSDHGRWLAAGSSS